MAPELVRLHPPRATPLEVWQLLLADGSTFSRAIRSDALALVEGTTLLHRGEGNTKDGRTAHRACEGFRHLVVGGGAATASLAPVLARGPTPFTLYTDGFVGEAGGLDLAGRRGYDRAETLVLDVGQTAIKVSYAGGRHRLERDVARLPRRSVPSSRRAEQREALCGFVSEALLCATAGRAGPRAVVVGLPGEIAEDGTPGVSSYRGTSGYRDLLPDALARASLAPAVVYVLNDAELAAASASLLPEASEKTLVLTLGFGLGSALLGAHEGAR